MRQIRVLPPETKFFSIGLGKLAKQQGIFYDKDNIKPDRTNT